MALRMLLVALVLACGFALRMAWEQLAEPRTPARAQVVVANDLDAFEF